MTYLFNRFFIIQFCFFSLVTTYAQSSDCSNIDFEDGSLANWDVQGNVTLVNKDQTDQYGNFPLALSGYYGVQLGNNQESELSVISKTLTITNANKYFVYGFAIVLLGYPHTEEYASYVTLRVTDQSGNDIACTSYIVYAESSVGNGFFQSSLPDETNLGGECCYPIFYKPWEINALDMTPYIGQTLTFYLESDWCEFNVDWGYAYADLYCASKLINEYVSCEDGLMYLGAVEGFDSYSWTGPGIVSGQGTNEIQIDEAGTYNLFIPNPNSQCDDLNLSFEATNEVLPDTPVADFNAVPNVCASFPVDFMNESSSESYITSVNWDFGDGDTSSLFSPSHLYGTVGTYEITLIVTNETNCVDTMTYIVNVIEGPELDLGPDRTLCNREETEITPIVHSGGNSYLWSTGETSQSIFVDEPQQLILSLSNGCTVSDTLNITDYGLYFGNIPNVITANSDLINDDFIIPTQPLEEYHIVITNRWGNKVFETDQPLVHWDGKFNGDYVEAGVYFYIIDYRLGCQESSDRKHGNVTVVR